MATGDLEEDLPLKDIETAPRKSLLLLHSLLSGIFLILAHNVSLIFTYCSKLGFIIKLAFNTFGKVVLHQYNIIKHKLGTYNTPKKLHELKQERIKHDRRGFCFVAECDYEGSNADLVAHVSKEHPNQLVILQADPDQKIDIGFSNPIKLMLQFEVDYHRNELYWIRLHEDQNQRYIMIYYHGSCGYGMIKPVYWQVSLKSQTFSLGFDIITKLVIESRDHLILDSVMKQAGTNITMIPGREYALQIYRKDHVVLSSEMLETIKCMVCYRMMSSPVMMCYTGHSTCKTCRDKITTCPLCNATYINNVRNYTLEAMLNQLMSTCVNYIQGCRERMKKCEIEAHEKVCLCRYVPCPDNSCNVEKMLFKNLYNHFSKNHNLHANEAEISLYKTEMVNINAFGNVFICKIGITNNDITCVAIHLVTDGTNYNVELKILDNEKAVLLAFFPCMIYSSNWDKYNYVSIRIPDDMANHPSYCCRLTVLKSF